MTSTNDDTEGDGRIAQMADALIAHLGGVDAALAFADRQMRAAERDALATWTTLAAYLERFRDRR